MSSSLAGSWGVMAKASMSGVARDFSVLAAKDDRKKLFVA